MNASIFGEIYQRHEWRGAESRSGPGSGLEQTRAIRRELPALLARLGIRSLLDAPCGDFAWMRHVDLGAVRYVGGDVVPEIVERSAHRFGDERRRFVVLDLTVGPLPRADLVLCRDGLVHLSFEDAALALGAIRRSGAAWLLATTFPAVAWNAPIATGGWRALNLQLPPFGFPPPEELLIEGCTESEGRYADKSLGLWRVGDLPLR